MKNTLFPTGILLVLSITLLHAQEPDGLLRVGDRPPALECTAYRSSQILSWESFKNRVVVVEFWATWCPPCIKNIPHINGLVKTFRNRPVTFLSVTYETAPMVRSFVAEHRIETIIGLDNDFAMFRSFKAWGIPMAVIVDRQGRIAAVTHPDHLNARILEDVLAGNIPRVEPAHAWPDPGGAEKYFRSLLAPPDSSAASSEGAR